MSDFSEFIPEHIKKLVGYAAGKPLRLAQQESGVAMEKMASNENPFGPSPRAIAAMKEAAERVNLYPDNDCIELRTALAQRHGLDFEQVMVTCGSTQALDIIARTLLSPGLNAVTSERSFIVYPICTEAAGGELIRVPMNGDTFDMEGLLEAINDKTRIVFIANPNNPTGTLIDPTTLDRFLDRVPEHVLVVLDEAYFEFANYFAQTRGLEYSHAIDYIRQGRNIIVLRTFSKAQGLAGLRVGYGLGPAELIRYFNRVRFAFSVSEVAQAGALAALGDDEHVRKTMENNAVGAAYLTRKLSALGLRVVPTWSNFLFVEMGENASDIGKRVQNEGVIIRPMTGNWGAPNCIRVTVGTPVQNEKFIHALSKVLEGQLAGSV
jgi:histidinol-phosphate aminotransferase